MYARVLTTRPSHLYVANCCKVSAGDPVFSPEISDSIGAFSRSRGTRRWCDMLHNFLHMSGTVLVPVHVKHIIALQIY